ncbi:uncharacterized protein [Elaeis guineensis]|uniref:uncharacterized protein isoform X1 n=1 Tax=Elaeis guineensis var. tenera TaxID=51953 RepID=UPI003C6CD63F
MQKSNDRSIKGSFCFNISGVVLFHGTVRELLFERSGMMVRSVGLRNKSGRRLGTSLASASRSFFPKTEKKEKEKEKGMSQDILYVIC